MNKRSVHFSEEFRTYDGFVVFDRIKAMLTRQSRSKTIAKKMHPDLDCDIRRAEPTSEIGDTRSEER